jgi:hypothetical protein
LSIAGASRAVFHTAKRAGGDPAGPFWPAIRNESGQYNVPDIVFGSQGAALVHGSVAKAPTRGARTQEVPSERIVAATSGFSVTCRAFAASTGVAKVAAAISAADRSFALYMVFLRGCEAGSGSCLAGAAGLPPSKGNIASRVFNWP